MEGVEVMAEGQSDVSLQRSWDRMPEENGKWYKRFCDFLDMAPEKRSLAGVYNAGRETEGKGRAKCAPETWVKASRKFKWLERAAAYDNDRRQEEEREHAEQQSQERAELYQLRRQAREDELANAQQIRSTALALLDKPIELVKEEKKVEGEDGKMKIVKVIVPSDHNSFGTAARMLLQASELSRRALQMPTSYQKFDFKRLSDEELLDLIERTSIEEEEEKARGVVDRDF